MMGVKHRSTLNLQPAVIIERLIVLMFGITLDYDGYQHRSTLNLQPGVIIECLNVLIFGITLDYDGYQT